MNARPRRARRSLQNLKQLLRDRCLYGPVGLLVYSWEQRREKLVRWAQAPSARYCHPREEHLLPLMVEFGAASGDAAKTVFNEKLLGTWVSSFQFGEASA